VSTWAARAKLHLSQKAQGGTDETDKTPISLVLSVHTGRFLEKRDSANDPAPTPTTAAVDVDLIPQQGDEVVTTAAIDPDRWPDSTAMTGRDADIFTARLARFTAKGVTHDEAGQLADKLATRDREADDRRLCLECSHLAGYGAGSWRCGNWQRAGVALRARDAGLPGDLVRLLQRCGGFTNASNQI
jgi:hypothetical protein